MKCIFFGSPYFSKEVLQHLLSTDVEIAAVVTMPDKPSGRGRDFDATPVKKYVVEHASDIDLHQPIKASTDEFCEILSKYGADIFIVVGYGEILSQRLLDIPLMAAINIHTSLLPAYRGAAPIQRALLAGESTIGVTIMHMDAHMDTGDMLLQESIEVGENEVYSDIEPKMIQLSCDMIERVITSYPNYRNAGVAQLAMKSSTAPKIQAEERSINTSLSVEKARNIVKAFGQNPGGSIKVNFLKNVKHVKIQRCELSEEKVGKGCLVVRKNEGVFLGCIDGVLKVTHLQVEGKRSMTAKQWLLGASSGIYEVI